MSSRMVTTSIETIFAALLRNEISPDGERLKRFAAGWLEEVDEDSLLDLRSASAYGSGLGDPVTVALNDATLTVL